MNRERKDDDRAEGSEQSRPERAGVIYRRGVHTALKNNATAYAFSISITSAYGLLSGTRGSVSPLETISFAIAGAVAFVALGAVFMVLTSEGTLPEGGQTLVIGGGADLLSVLIAVGVASGLSRVPGFAAWPLTAFGTVMAFLLVGGVDVVLARAVAQRRSFDRSD